MEFFRLNYRKLPFILCLCILLSCAILGIGYLSSNRDNIAKNSLNAANTHTAVTAIELSVAFFLIYFLRGMYNFYRARELLQYVASLDIFHNGTFVKEHKITKPFLFYNGEWILSTISRYPTVVSISPKINYYTNIVISLCVVKFNQTTIENISFRLFLEQPKASFKKDVVDFVKTVIDKGYAKGNLVQGKEKVRKYL